jgi:serine/threonine-protein kinase
MGFLDFFKSKTSAQTAGPKAAEKPTRLGRVGRRLDIKKRFELLREAVSGTMSKFYKAFDRQENRVVGLKVLDPEKTKAFEDRFKGLKKPSEGEISVKLVHKNIVRTYEHGITTDREPYLVMEFIDGPGLNYVLLGEHREILEGNLLPLLRQIGEALNAVHLAGFIHRDVCPRNVIVDTQEGLLKLIDFGLTIPNKPEFCQPGNRTGNPNYMAPELVKRQKTDVRVDIFAFGVTAYELCCGQLPWGARGLTGRAAMDHVARPADDIREHRPAIHPALSDSIMKCLEQEPAKRIGSMDEFLRRIKHVQFEDKL